MYHSASYLTVQVSVMKRKPRSGSSSLVASRQNINICVFWEIRGSSPVVPFHDSVTGAGCKCKNQTRGFDTGERDTGAESKSRIAVAISPCVRSGSLHVPDDPARFGYRAKLSVCVCLLPYALSRRRKRHHGYIWMRVYGEAGNDGRPLLDGRKIRIRACADRRAANPRRRISRVRTCRQVGRPGMRKIGPLTRTSR